MKKKEIARDKYYLKHYGITESYYQQILTEQGGVCRICRRPPKDIRLAVDHDHGINKVKLLVGVYGGYPFVASFTYNGKEYHTPGETKLQARENARKILKAASIRGLLCSQCNRALGKVENPRWQWGPEQLRKAADYLEDFHGKGNS